MNKDTFKNIYHYYHLFPVEKTDSPVQHSLLPLPLFGEMKPLPSRKGELGPVPTSEDGSAVDRSGEICLIYQTSIDQSERQIWRTF